jgi:hypothetical protein
MKMSFLPGQLELYEEEGRFIVSLKGEVVLRTPHRKAAVSKFNSIRRSMEDQFPLRPPRSVTV